VEALEGGARTRILAFATMARYASERLLFVRDHVLYAEAFDLSRLQLVGDPVPLAENVATVFAGSESGAVAYVPLSSSEQADSGQLEWFDRSGKKLGRIEKATGAFRPALSPDGRRLAMNLGGSIWTLELERSVLSRLAVGISLGGSPTWLPDSQRLMFNRAFSSKNRRDIIYEQAIGSAAKETIVQEPDAEGDHAHPTDISADGQYLIYEGGDAYDIWVKRLTGDQKATAYVQAPSIETQGTLSPDGRSLAYTSDSSDRFEIYVQSFPEPGPWIQVSANGGSSAHWRRDGKELFYLAPDGTLMAVPVRSAHPVEFGPPAALFRFDTQRRGIPAGRPPYDVTPDGQRFIVSAVVRRTDPSINVLLNWPALVAAKR
jgi:Tol biopolymer transport system component